MGTRPQFCHGAKILLLFGRQAVETHAEEALVERRYRCTGSDVDGIDTNRRCLRGPPSVAAPLLQKIGIALGDEQDLVQSLRCDTDSLVLKRLRDGESCRCGRKWPADQPAEYAYEDRLYCFLKGQETTQNSPDCSRTHSRKAKGKTSF